MIAFTPGNRRIVVYGHSKSQFPTPDALIDYINQGVVKNRNRYRYTQTKNADVIVLSLGGRAFGHFEIMEKIAPEDEDRDAYAPARCVYIVARRASYSSPVALLRLSIRVNTFGVRISEAQFDGIKLGAGHIQEFA